MHNKAALVIIAVLVLASCGSQTALLPTAMPTRAATLPSPTPSSAPRATQLRTATPVPAIPSPYPSPYSAPVGERPPRPFSAFAPTSSPNITSVVEVPVQRLPDPGAGPKALAFVDKEHGWLSVDNALLATIDSGQHWHTVYTATEPLDSLSFVSRLRGWAVIGKRVFATRDGGVTWQPLAALSAMDVGKVDFVDRLHGWVKEPQDIITILWRTVDGGATWTKVVDPCFANGDATSRMNFINPQLGWAMCGSQPGTGFQGKELFRTRDGGMHWESVVRADFGTYHPHSLDGTGYLTSVFFLDATHGWYGSSHSGTGGLDRTIDAGRTWEGPVYWVDTENPFAIQFLSPTQGYMLVDHGATKDSLIATSDSGATWRPLYPPLVPLGAIQFFDQTHGIATGSILDPSAILRTSDAGHTWMQVATLKARSVEQVYFADAQNGCIEARRNIPGTIDEQTLVYRTADGGTTWGVRADEAQCYTDPLPSTYGWRIGNKRLIHTDDNGATWTQYTLRQAADPTSVSFVDADHGWFMDAMEHLFATSDGGQHWAQVY